MPTLKQEKGGGFVRIKSFEFQKLLINVGRNVKEHCFLRTNLIISRVVPSGEWVDYRLRSIL